MNSLTFISWMALLISAVYSVGDKSFAAALYLGIAILAILADIFVSYRK
jgi:hypothetical protein